MNPLPNAHTRLHFLHFVLENFKRIKAGLVFVVLQLVVSRVVDFHVVPKSFILRSVRVSERYGSEYLRWVS